MTTTAPNRGDGTKVSGGNGKRPERPVPATRERVDRTAWRKVVMLLNVVLIAGVAIIGVTQLRSEDTPEGAVATDPTAGAASTLSDPDAEPSPAPSSAPATEAPATDTPATEAPATGAPSGEVVEAPRVRPTMRSNFAKGDSWPVEPVRLPTDSVSWVRGRWGSSTADDPRPARRRRRRMDEDRPAGLAVALENSVDDPLRSPGGARSTAPPPRFPVCGAAVDATSDERPAGFQETRAEADWAHR